MAQKNRCPISSASLYVHSLFRYAGLRAAVSLALLVVISLTQGIGLLMLIPFLNLLGLTEAGGSGGETVGWVARNIQGAGLPFTLQTVLVGYLGLAALHAVFKRCQHILNAEVTHGYTKHLRDQLYKALIQAEWLLFVRTRASDITHVLTYDLQRVGFGTQQLLQLIGTAAVAMVHIGVALTVSVPLTALALACGFLLLAVMMPYHRQAQRSGNALRRTMSDILSAITEHLNGMKLAKSYGLELRHADNFCETTGSLVSQYLWFARVSADTRMYYEIGIAVFMGCFLFAAVHVVHQPGTDLLVMIFIFARLLPKFSGMQQTVQQVINALPCFKAVDQMRQRFEAAKEGCRIASTKPVVLKKGVEIRRASFRYDDKQGVYALRDMNLFIPAGSITAVVGPSGGGKSTLADLLLGLFVPEEGAILIDDEPLNGKRMFSWRSCVGYVPQETFLFHDTVRGNLKWARPEAGENELWQSLHLAAADRFVAGLPKGLDTVVGDRGMRLSGGERQRIALARALLRKPALLLLDEATSALDTKNETRIQKAVEKLHGQLTIVVIAHRLSTVQNADRIWVMTNGQVTEKGTWDELVAKPGGWFRSMWNAGRGIAIDQTLADSQGV